MSSANGYVKRFKSLSLLILGMTLLTYNVTDSGRRLDADYAEVQALFLISHLVQVEMGDNSHITAVNGEPSRDWLAAIGHSLPDIGPMVNVINSWNVPKTRIDGTFTLSNGESYEFSRLPATNVSNGNGFPGNKFCHLADKATCHRYAIRQAGMEIVHAALLVYGINPSDATSHSKMSWRYFDIKRDELLTMDQVAGRVVRLAIPWLGTTNSAESAYQGLRKKREERTVRIPVVNIDVKASQAALFISLFAVVVAALMTHSLIVIGSMPVASIDEPWIILMPELHSNTWTGHLQSILSIGGAMAVTALIWCPVVITGFSISMTPSIMLIALQWILLAITSAAAITSTINLRSIMKAVHAQNPDANKRQSIQ